MRANQGERPAGTPPAGVGPQRRARPAILILVAGGVLLALGWALFGSRFGGSGASSNVTPVAVLQAADYHALAVSPQDGDHLWFGAHDGVQESTDGGRTWRRLPGATGDAMTLALSPAAPARLYMAGHDVFKRSTDGGRTWLDITTDLPGTDLHGLATDPTDARHLYAVLAGQGLFTSGDGGNHWQPVAVQPPAALGGLALTSGSPAHLYMVSGSRGVLYSRDGGASGHPAGAGLPEAGTLALLPIPGQAQQLYAGTPDGRYRTTDGVSWQAVGLAGQRIVALAASSAGPLRVYVLTATGQVFRLEGALLGAHYIRPSPG